MSKEVQMTIRIEPELRAEFTEAASKSHRPAAQVLRELMRAYVTQVSQERLAPANDALSLAERRRREDAVAFARSSVSLEGFQPSEPAEVHARRFISGDIQLSEFVQVMPGVEPAQGR